MSDTEGAENRYLEGLFTQLNFETGILMRAAAQAPLFGLDELRRLFDGRAHDADVSDFVARLSYIAALQVGLLAAVQSPDDQFDVDAYANDLLLRLEPVRRLGREPRRAETDSILTQLSLGSRGADQLFRTLNALVKEMR